MLRNSENPLSINKLTLSALFCLMVPHELNTDQDTVYCEQDIKNEGVGLQVCIYDCYRDNIML